MWAAVALCLSLTHASVLVQDASGPCDPRGCLGLETGKSGTCYAPDEGHTDDTVPEESADCNGDCICWVPIIGKISPLQSFSHLPQLPSEHGNSNEGNAIHCTGKETGKVGYCYNADDIHTTDTIPESSDDCTANTTCWVPIVGAGSVDFGTFVREDGRADISIVRMKQLVRESGEAGTGFTIASPDMEANATGIKLIMYYPTYKETVQVNFTGEEKQIEFNVDVLNPDNGIPSGNSSIIWIEISAFDDPESLMPIAEGHVEFVLPDADADFIATWVGEEGTDATPCLRVVPGTKDVMINGVGTCLSTEDVCYYLEDKDILAVSTCKLVENIAAQLPTEPNSQVSVCPAEDPDQYVATPGDTILELNGTNLAVTSTVEDDNQPDSYEVIAYDPHDPSVIFTEAEDFACQKMTSKKPGESQCTQKLNLPKEQKLMNVIVVALDEDGNVMHSQMTAVNVIYEVEKKVEIDQGAVIAAGTLGGILGLVILVVLINKFRK